MKEVFKKNSEEWLLMNDFWTFWQKYNIPESDDEYWDSFAEELKAIVFKYKGTELETLAMDIFIKLSEYIENKSKKNFKEKEKIL